jgi:serine/threonine-protein kinase
LSASLIGKVVGTWKLVARLGEGGMGEVYLAEHQSIGRKAAVKVLHPAYAAQPAVVERFFNEARAANRVKHPSIIEVWDYGQSPDVGVYFVMEFLEGESLQTRLKRRLKLPPAEMASVLSRVASAVGAAHKAGIIHRDLKPDNVFILPDSDHPTGERVKVLDFGIAKLGGDGALGGSQTRTGSVMGTPIYMSPEQCHGAKGVDARTDVYSLGVMAYEALCGRPPFIAQGFGEMLAKHLSQAPTPLREVEPSVPAKMDQVVLRALAKDPDERWPSMEAFGAALIDAVDGAVRQSSPVLDASAAGAPVGATRVLSSPGAGGAGGPPPASATEMLDSQPTMHASGIRRSTLSSSAAEVAGAPRHGAGWKVAVGLAAALVVAGGVAAAVVVLGGLGAGDDGVTSDDTSRDARRTKHDRLAGSATPTAEPETPETGATGDVHHDPATGSPKGTGTGAASATPEPPATATATATGAATATAKATTVRHIIESDPVAASVVRVSDGAELGITPWDGDEPTGVGKVTYEVRKDGYKPVRVTLSAAHDGRKTVKLAAARGKVVPAHTAAPSPATARPKTPKEPATHAPELPTPD